MSLLLSERVEKWVIKSRLRVLADMEHGIRNERVLLCKRLQGLESSPKLFSVYVFRCSTKVFINNCAQLFIDLR